VIRISEGAWALVTGASSGIGEAIARKLAARGVPLLLVARSAARLEALGAELRSVSGAAAVAIPLDLALPGAAVALFAASEGEGRRVDLLVNAAGFGWNGPQTGFPDERFLELLRLNVETTAGLTHRFLRAMAGRGTGAILNVASTTAFLPMPYFAAYAASKAFILSFTHALHEEAKRDGVTVTALCPGYTRTRFCATAGMKEAEATPFFEMTPEAVADAGLRALERKKPFAVADWHDRLWIAAGRLAPRTWPPRIAAAIFSKTRL
jgi:uncharacterized protein